MERGHTTWFRVRRIALRLMLMTGLIGGSPAGARAQDEGRARIPRHPCRLVVKGTLLAAVERGIDVSPTLRRQCEDLAEARAVVSIEWDQPNAPWYARTRMNKVDGVMVAWIGVPPVAEAVGYVGHELHHVIEQIRGLDYEAESKRPDSGVWQAVGGYETQAAIDAGRQVWREVQAGAADAASKEPRR
jgi:hypothetical protein